MKHKFIFLGAAVLAFLIAGVFGAWTDLPAQESGRLMDPESYSADLPMAADPNSLPDTGDPTSGDDPQSGSGTHDLPIEPAALEARAALAAELGLQASRILVLQVESREWSDSCLGLGGPAESCAFMITEGFRITLKADGKTYFYRTDKAGSSVRAE